MSVVSKTAIVREGEFFSSEQVNTITVNTDHNILLLISYFFKALTLQYRIILTDTKERRGPNYALGSLSRPVLIRLLLIDVDGQRRGIHLLSGKGTRYNLTEAFDCLVTLNRRTASKTKKLEGK